MSGARDQVSRLLALVPYLNGREIPIDTVAKDFGVTPARIIADLRVLYFCGLPGLMPGDLIDIDFDALGPDGDKVVRLTNADYLHRPLRLNATEAAALVVALRTLRESSGEAPRDVVEQVLAKLETVTGPSGQVGHVVDVPAHRSAVDPYRGRIEEALKRRRQLRLDYLVPARDAATSRVVDPIAVLSRDGHDYLDAWCHLAEARRLFRLDRIMALEVTSTAAAIHDLTPRNLSEGLFEPGASSLVATVQVAPTARWIAEYYPVESVTDLPDGGLRLTMLVSDPEWLVRLMMRLWPEAMVELPTSIRQRVADLATQTLALYDG